MAKRERGRYRVCVCAGDMQLICPKAETERVREGGKGGGYTAAQRAASALVVLLISLATKGSNSSSSSRHCPCHMPCSAMPHSVAGSIELRQSLSAHLLASSLNVQSAPAAGSLPATCCCSCCHCNVCNFLINAIMS